MRLFICSTYYHVFTVLLKRFSDATIKDSDLVITDYIPDGEPFANKLRRYNLFHSVAYVRNPLLYDETYLKYPFKRRFFPRRDLVKAVERNNLIDFGSYSDIYLFMDDIWLARYFKCKGIFYNIIEDGLNSLINIKNGAFAYMVRPKRTFKYFVKILLGQAYLYYDKCKYIKTIEVNDKNGLAIATKKVIEVKKETLINSLKDAQKQTMLDIFLPDSFPALNSNNIAFLYTSSVGTDGLVRDDQLLVFVKYVAEKFRNYDILLKPHPRDKNDYSGIPGIALLPKSFPSEILLFIDQCRIQKYISIASRSVDAFPREKVVFYSVEDVRSFRAD